MIRNIQLNHAGKYVCIIDTDVESLSVDAVLIVEGNESSCYMYSMLYELLFLKQASKLLTVYVWSFGNLQPMFRGLHETHTSYNWQLM